MTRLAELIDREPVTAQPAQALAAAAEAMYRHRIGSVCVVDETGALVGILTERDLLRACAEGVDTQQATIERWMTPDPVTARARDHAAAALQVMIDRGFRHLPVLEGSGLVGVVSIRQLSREVQAQRMG